MPRDKEPANMNDTDMNTLHYGQKVLVTTVKNDVPIKTDWMYVVKRFSSTRKENICVSPKLGGKFIYEIKNQQVHMDIQSAISWVIHKHERLEQTAIRTHEANMQFLASARLTSLKSLGISAREELEAIEAMS